MAKKSNSFTASLVNLIEVRVIEGRVESHEEFDTSKITAYDPDCSLRLFVNIDHGFLRSDLKVWVNSESEPSQPEAHGHFHFIFLFSVKEIESWVSELENGSQSIDSALQNAIASVSYSTARGILLSRFQGTAFSRFILPVINPNDLLQSPVNLKQRANAKHEKS
jgi:hypothetical protein